MSNDAWKDHYDTLYEVEQDDDLLVTVGSLDEAKEFLKQNKLYQKAVVYEVFRISRLVKID